ncbi:MAG TPA: BON domain-containing protein [Puia sp.]|jgi:osmotically-inducible protein OsmY|nr:BON domain-containing protein [Puia sp.]
MRNENEILEEVKLRVNSILCPGTIDVAVDGNIAVLTGHVPSLEKRNEVAMTAAYVSGIEGVENKLTISAPEYIL